MFVRIDDRFIHGQVGVSWISYAGAKEILIANDEIVNDPLACTMQKLSASGSKVTIKTVEEAMQYITAKTEKEIQQLFIIVNSPQDILRMLDLGLEINHINVGHCQPRKEFIEIAANVHIGKSELNAYKAIQEKGVEVEFRLVPSDKKKVFLFKDINLKED